MAHQRLRLQETLPDGVRRIALEQIDRSLDRLTQRSGNRDRAIHDTRVCFKKVRALLRMVRFDIGEAVFSHENIFYRDVGRQLAALRDTAVVADVLESLINDFADQPTASSLKWLRKHILSSRVERRSNRKQVLQEIAQVVALARHRVENWPLHNDSFSLLDLGIQEVYRKGRRGYLIASLDPTPDGLHEWRKQVKHLWYHTCVLNPIWPKMLDAQAFELNRIAGHLSNDRDLLLLRQNMLEQALSSSKAEDVQIAIETIDLRRSALQRKAIAIGARVYFEKPRRFGNRLQGYWDAWRPESISKETGAGAEFETTRRSEKHASVAAL